METLSHANPEPIMKGYRLQRLRQAGFGLLEAVVALFVVAVVMSLAAVLIGDAQRMLNASSRDATDPMPRYAIVALHRDLASARAVSDPLLPGFWVSTPLDIYSAEPGLARIQQSGDQLVRTKYDGAGHEVHRRVLLQGIAGWRWRKMGGDLVDVELRYLRTPLSIAGSSPLDASRRDAKRPVVDRFRVALRGSRSSSRW